MVYRIYVRKKEGYDPKEKALLEECHDFLNISGIEKVKIYKRYDIEGIDDAIFNKALNTVLSEPPVDDLFNELDFSNNDFWLAIEALPGQFDMRANSTSECLQLLSQQDQAVVKCATIYDFKGNLNRQEAEAIKHYLINPVESREASFELPLSLKEKETNVEDIKTINGFISLNEEELKSFLNDYSLAMDLNDLKCLQNYFKEENRDPTITELRVIDTYWSDHCRHTTFSTHLKNIQIDDELIKNSFMRYLRLREEVYGEKAHEKPITLMDVATIGAKALKKRGLLKELDESKEINACSIKIEATVDDVKQDWLLMFKNETHNHPTEIEPYGGAATCLGGCIRDPLSGRAYVHQAMRISGSGDPRMPLKETWQGKLAQRKIAKEASAGYSSYGNQIGLATGLVDEIYHEGYIAKHLECGAVVGALPLENLRREEPVDGDVVILLGGKTGRDGIGGATGSSKSHNLSSLNEMASEVQKGNPPEERKIQRLFRKKEVSRLIKRCNDFGAGGVAVAIGELADGLEINLDAIHKKYAGLDGTELAISESQERMAVVVAGEDVDKFISEAYLENLESYPVATVKNHAHLIMYWRGQKIVDLKRSFLSTNGATRYADVLIPRQKRNNFGKQHFNNLREMASSLKRASRQGLSERFDSTVGARTLLMPYGGKKRRSPSQAMAALLPVDPGSNTKQGSLMAYGFDPDLMALDPYLGAYASVYISLAKSIASGGDYHSSYLSLQEFFPKLNNDPLKWGKPLAALLGALDAQLQTQSAAIGGKDSMSGTFLDKEVPSTLISFALTPVLSDDIISTDFKEANHNVALFAGSSPNEQLAIWDEFISLNKEGKIKAAMAVDNSIADALMKMSFGNEIGFTLTAKDIDLYRSFPGAIIAEVEDYNSHKIGETNAFKGFICGKDSLNIDKLYELNQKVLENIYPRKTNNKNIRPKTISSYNTNTPILSTLRRKDRPKFLIPVFPGTNCEYDTADAIIKAGGQAQIFVLRNIETSDVIQSAHDFANAIKDSQAIVIPGGFSGGDEPDGSAKLIATFFRSQEVKDATTTLLDENGGLMLGICNGFQALIKLGLVPYGKIMDIDVKCSTLSYNTIGRHQSQIIRTRISSTLSPWLGKTKVSEVYDVAISHGEGRFIADNKLIENLILNGQIATQYVDEYNLASMDIEFNPNGSLYAIEGITSPDGRVLGKMGHSERIGKELYKNVKGNYDLGLFQSAINYFKK